MRPKSVLKWLNLRNPRRLSLRAKSKLPANINPNEYGVVN